VCDVCVWSKRLKEYISLASAQSTDKNLYVLNYSATLQQSQQNHYHHPSQEQNIQKHMIVVLQRSLFPCCSATCLQQKLNFLFNSSILFGKRTAQKKGILSRLLLAHEHDAFLK
tara:strand:+ start:392 stop:733 length:342 start_codon:yes stop_codon:yes gene_type:complete